MSKSRKNNPQLRLILGTTAVAGTLAITGCSHFDWLNFGDSDSSSDSTASADDSNAPQQARKTFKVDRDAPIPDKGSDIPADIKTVIEEGRQLRVDTAEGKIQIEAGPGSRRVFNWHCARRGAITKPRKELFAGESHKGLYFDGKPEEWEPVDGVNKLRYEEGQRDFDNADDALIWMQIRRIYYTYNDDGIAVGWKKQGDTLHVEVWQFTINGQKPSEMPKSTNDRLKEGDIEEAPLESYCIEPEDKNKPSPDRQEDRDKKEDKGRNWFQRHIADPIVNFFTGD